MKENELITFGFEQKGGIWTGAIENNFALICEASNDGGEKPILLAPLANRQQLQVILDNQHLFDTAFVNAVRILVMHYDNTIVKEE